MDPRPTYTAASLLLAMTSPLAAQAIVSGGRTLMFPAGSGGRGLSIAASDGVPTAAQSTPAGRFLRLRALHGATDYVRSYTTFRGASSNTAFADGC